MKGKAVAIESAIADLGLLRGLAAGTGDLPIKLIRRGPGEHVKVGLWSLTRDACDNQQLFVRPAETEQLVAEVNNDASGTAG